MNPIEKAPSNERETVDRLVSELPRLLEGLDIVKTEVLPKARGGVRPDLVVDVRFGRQTKRLVVEVKTLGEPRLAAQAIAHLGQSVRTIDNGYPVFASGYVGGSARRLCRESGVGYIDLLGNVYLRFGGVLIDRLAQGSFEAERRGLKQLFAPKATRVVRALLLDPERPARITDLAVGCSMSPAGVYWVVRLLEDMGFVERDRSKRVVLVKPKELLDAWASSWGMDRNASTGYFSFERTPEALVKKVASVSKRRDLPYALTLMAGASLVAPFVRFQDVWMYVGGDEAAWVEALDLKPVDGGGNIVLVRPYDEGVFAGLQVVDGIKVVSDVQLYVDLYNYPARGREQAEFLRGRRLGV
jgi:hypothetical protein